MVKTYEEGKPGMARTLDFIISPFHLVYFSSSWDVGLCVEGVVVPGKYGANPDSSHLLWSDMNTQLSA